MKKYILLWKRKQQNKEKGLKCLLPESCWNQLLLLTLRRSFAEWTTHKNKKPLSHRRKEEIRRESVLLKKIGLCVFPAPFLLLLLLSDSWGSNTDKWELQLATTPLTYSPFPPFPLSLNVWVFRLFSLLENPTKNRPCSSDTNSFVFLLLSSWFEERLCNCYRELVLPCRIRCV